MCIRRDNDNDAPLYVTSASDASDVDRDAFLVRSEYVMRYVVAFFVQHTQSVRRHCEHIKTRNPISVLHILLLSAYFRVMPSDTTGRAGSYVDVTIVGVAHAQTTNLRIICCTQNGNQKSYPAVPCPPSFHVLLYGHNHPLRHTLRFQIHIVSELLRQI